MYDDCLEGVIIENAMKGVQQLKGLGIPAKKLCVFDQENAIKGHVPFPIIGVGDRTEIDAHDGSLI
jgi:hypothetical protein